MRKIYLTICFALLAWTLHAQVQMPKHEVRAVWLTTIGGIDWPHTYATAEGGGISAQQRELCQILDRLKAANVNVVLFQTRVRGTMIYPSQYEPWDPCLSGKPGVSPGYDALQFAIDECHKRGMELHAWIVTIPVGKWNKIGCLRLRSKMPKVIRKIGDEGYMNPESSETAEYMAAICREITSRYDIDGIHLDYIRYPETWRINVARPTGREHITRIVRRIHQEVKALKPWVMVSCAPIGKADDLNRYRSNGWNAYTRVCQDAQNWLKDGLMDALFPMMYFRGNQFFPFATDWQEQSYERIVAPGIGTYMLSPREQNWDLDVVKREMNYLRQLGLGHAHFRSKFLTDNVKGIYDFTADEYDHTPALVPAMTWLCSTPPDAPTQLQITETAQGTQLQWQGACDHSGADYLLYNVYASANAPVDTSDPRQLVATRVIGNTTTVRLPASYHFAFCALDRYGNESVPYSVDQQPVFPASASTQLLSNDGQKLQVPAQTADPQAEYLAIETLQGTIIATRPNAPEVDITDIPRGVYVLKNLNTLGITGCLGYFIK